MSGGQRHHGQKEVGHGGGDVFLGNHFLFFLGKSGMVESSGELMVPKRFKVCGDVQYILYMYTGYIYMYIYINICIHILMIIYNDMPSRLSLKMSRLEPPSLPFGGAVRRLERRSFSVPTSFTWLRWHFFGKRRIYSMFFPFEKGGAKLVEKIDVIW